MSQIQEMKMSVSEEDTKYFIHDKTRGYVGNSMVWWRKDHHGYTCDLSEAHVFSSAELSEYLGADDLVAYPCEEVEKCTERHVVRLMDRALAGQRLPHP